ncbi:hypothetical protein Q7A53_05290 [Halobacillus rhizosphaerae]|uniref:hypothetical protein n=1 Tax=Halobacillus rhizosphaerae TaxID=3064889 RepID=UPI00398AFF72
MNEKNSCKHTNLQDCIYLSEPPKRKCLDCGGFFTEAQLQKNLNKKLTTREILIDILECLESMETDIQNSRDKFDNTRLEHIASLRLSIQQGITELD